MLSRLSERAFLLHSADTSKYFIQRLEMLPRWFPSILQPVVRGRGHILGLGFKDVNNPARLISMARERGLILLTAGKDAVRLVPSLNVEKADIDVAVDVIESCLGQMLGR